MSDHVLCRRGLLLVAPRNGGTAKPFSLMLKKPIKVEIVQEGDERFIVRAFAGGEETREPVVKLPRKKRYPPRSYWHWVLYKGSKRGF